MATPYKSLEEINSTIHREEKPILISKFIKDPKSITTLGLDFGLNCGFAYSVYSNTNKAWYIFPDSIGVYKLSTSRYESGSTAFLRLRDLCYTINPKYIFYEDIKFTPSFAKDVNPAAVIARAATSAELLTSLRQTVLLWAEDNNIPCVGVPIGTIKKYATGKGRAKKEEVIQACNEKFNTNLDPNDNGSDNAADAAFVLYAGLSEYNIFE